MLRTRDEQRSPPGRAKVDVSGDVTRFAGAIRDSLQARARDPSVSESSPPPVNAIVAWGVQKQRTMRSYRPNKCRLIVEPRETDTESSQQDRSAVKRGVRNDLFND